MKISFSLEKLESEIEEYSFKDENPLSRFMNIIVERLNNLDIHLNVDHEQNKDQVITIILIDNPEVFDSFNINTVQPVLGLFAVTTGDGILDDSSYYSDNFKVLINTNLDTFKEIMDDEENHNENFNHLNFLERYLMTIPHEINHVFEFIENSQGLTPYEVDVAYDAEEFPYTINECSTGLNTPKYSNDYLGYETDIEINDIMEERVEYKGRRLFYKLNIEDNLMNSCLEEILKPNYQVNKKLNLF